MFFNRTCFTVAHARERILSVRYATEISATDGFAVMVSKAKTATKVNGLAVQVDFVVFYVYVLAHCHDSQSDFQLLYSTSLMGQDLKALFLFSL